MPPTELTLSRPELVEMLGDENAENENLPKLKQFFLHTNISRDVSDSSRLCIIVAHRGIGKTALLRISRDTHTTNGYAVLDIKPADIAKIPDPQLPFAERVNEWVFALREIILRYYLHSQSIAISDEVEAMIVIAKRAADPLKNLHNQFNQNSPSLAPSVHESQVRIMAYLDDIDLGWQSGPDKGDTNDIQRIAALLTAAQQVVRENQVLYLRIALRSGTMNLARSTHTDGPKADQYCTWVKWDDHEILAMLVKRVQTYISNNQQTPLETHNTDSSLLEMKNGTLAQGWLSLFETSFDDNKSLWGKRQFAQVIRTVSRRRPRDYVKFIRLAGTAAHDRLRNSTSGNKVNLNRITTIDVINTFSSFSSQIFEEICVEFGSELPKIRSVLNSFTPSIKQYNDEITNCFVFTASQLTNKMEETIKNGDRFDNNTPFEFNKSLKLQMTASALFNFLYRINFVIRRELPSGSRTKTHRDGTQTTDNFQINRMYYDVTKGDSDSVEKYPDAIWEVHPAFQYALLPSDNTYHFRRIAISWNASD